MSNNLVTAFSFEGNSVTFFDRDGTLYVNATEMAKPFGKAKIPSFWLNQKNTNEFLNELAKLRNLSLADLQRVTRGGNSAGTWFHKDVAIEFARWLSPKFAIWCNSKIEELLTRGRTELRPSQNFEIPQTYADALLLAAQQAKQIEESRKEIEESTRRIKEQCATIHDQAEKIIAMQKDNDYCQTILNNPGLTSTTSIAQDYGYSAIAFNKMLRKYKVQYYCGSQWILTAAYKDKGYVQSETFTVDKSDDRQKVVTHTKWTQKGRRFLYEFLKKKGVIPMIEVQANATHPYND